MNNNEKLNAFLKLHGRSLYEFHIHGYGLSFSNTQRAIELAGRLNVPVLGGEVLIIRDGRLTVESSEFVAWHTTQNENESHSAYVEHSVTYAQQYLASLPKKYSNEKYIFEIVFGTEIHSRIETDQKSFDVFFEYVEPCLSISFPDDVTVLFVYGKRQIKIRVEKLPNGIILDANTIQSWLPPYEKEPISDSEKELVQKLISGYLEKHNTVYGWIENRGEGSYS